MPNMKEIFASCPICGKKMEKGYLRCRTPVLGWGWVKERKLWTQSTCITEACRCRNCKLIVLSSDIIES